MPSRRQPIDHPTATPLLRWMADMMELHALCGRAKCRRGHACNGEPRQCLARCAPLVPEEAREGVKAMLDGKLEGLTFDEARDEFAAIEDLLAWRELVESCGAQRR